MAVLGLPLLHFFSEFGLGWPLIKFSFISVYLNFIHFILTTLFTLCNVGNFNWCSDDRLCHLIILLFQALSDSSELHLKRFSFLLSFCFFSCSLLFFAFLVTFCNLFESFLLLKLKIKRCSAFEGLANIESIFELLHVALTRECSQVLVFVGHRRSVALLELVVEALPHLSHSCVDLTLALAFGF